MSFVYTKRVLSKVLRVVSNCPVFCVPYVAAEKPSLVASSGIPLHRGKWQHFPLYSVCLSVRVLPVACAPPTVRLSQMFVSSSYVFYVLYSHAFCISLSELAANSCDFCGGFVWSFELH